ncbi:MAG: HDOD domain-containing protein [Gemmatimonadetes bacterium]|nr:HDOD domain-containing protein [Gemmatimonadota bacterium]
MTDFCLVRQPVFGVNGALIAYDLRFNDPEEGQQAFAQSLLNGTFDLVRNRQPAFVAATREQLLGDAFLVAEAGSTIVMLPRDLAPDADVIEAVKRYRQAGGVLALEAVRTDAAPADVFLPWAQWARVPARGASAEQMAQVHRRIGEIIASVPGATAPSLLACDIEQNAEYEAVRALGFAGFQGSFFSRPEPLPSAQMPQGTVAAMRLMGMARNPDCSDRQLEDVIATDPVLTFQLLRLVNSAALGGRGVSSIGQALRLIGRSAFLRWLAVAVAATRKSKTGVDQELVRQAVERGRLLEQLAGGGRDGGTLFLVGLFSLLDGVFRMPLDEILQRVVLSDDAVAALLRREGPYADALTFAESYELGLFEHATQLARDLGVNPDKISEFYTNAIVWTAEALSAALEPAGAGAGTGAGLRRAG